ncbi:MAG TPA: class I SAM-dependent methyltransferase [Burkholderiales bacterium]|jgi:cyclopropane-fatty-acyl-phospholipid synthase|nr:class I SAM-dependent methyltransferase [Burkholderiales bacterium]
MLLESRIEKTIAALRAQAEVPLAIELWNGRRYELGDEPHVTFRVNDAQALKRISRPDFASLGEAYVEGDLELEGPIDEALRAVESLAKAWGRTAGRRMPHLGAHNRKSDSEAIRYHYDVSNDFYRLFLDERMVYSCAYFKTGAEDIHAAQEQKLDHICRKLRLAPGDRFLDVGCGWGALVMHAAQKYGVHATGVTLSENQHAYANAQIGAAGLQDRCQVLLRDYRDIAGEYDKIASVGMFEHVGLKNLPAYFGIIHKLLADGGIVMNHGITSVDIESREVGLGAGEFIGKYVFPDGELPHLSLVLREVAGAGLEAMDVETLRLHYARTLAHWSRRLEANLEAAHAHAGKKRVRIWRLYLAGCAHAFARNWISIHQVLAVKSSNPGRNPLPWTREYMYR